MKKTIITSLLILCMSTTMLFAGCSNTKNNSEIDTTAATDTTAEQVGKNGAASSYGDNKYIQTNTGSVSEEVILKQPVGKIKYLKGIYTGSPSNPEHNTEEVKAKRRQNAQRYLDELGVKDKINFTTNFTQSETFSLEHYLIAANESTLSVTPPSVPFDINVTNEEIISYLKSDKYLSLLQTFSGVNLDNAFIMNDTDGSLDILSQTDDDEYYVFRTITICNKSDSPEQLAFDLAFNCIKFWIVATKESLNEQEVSFYAKWMDDEYIVETNVDPAYFTTAKKQADDLIETELPSNEYKIENKENATYRIVYDSSLKENYIIPCYQFFYPTNKADFVVGIRVPCMDMSTLE